MESVPVATPAAPLPQPVPSRGRRWSRRSLISGGIAAAMCALSAIFWPTQPQVSLAELQGGALVDLRELPGFHDAFEPRLPGMWTSTFAIDRRVIRGYPGTGPATGQVALVPFQLAVHDHQETLRGRLLIARKEQVRVKSGKAVDAITDFADAKIHYIAGSADAYVVWQEHDLVFMCIMSGGPHDLQRFQRILLSRSRSTRTRTFT